MIHVDSRSGMVRVTYIGPEQCPVVYLRERAKIRPYSDVWTTLAEVTGKLLERIESEVSRHT